MTVFINILRSFWQAKKTTMWYACIAIILSCIAQIISVVILPMYVARITDALPLGEVIVKPLLITFCIMVGIKFLSFRLSALALIKTEANTMKNLENELFRNILRRSIQFHSRHESGKIMNRIMKFVSAYEVVFDQLSFTIIPSITVGIAASIVAFSQLPVQFGILIIGTVIGFCIVSYWAIKIQQPHNIAKSIQSTKMNQRLADVLANFVNVKVDAAEKYETQRYIEANEKRFTARVKNWLYGELKTTAQAVITEGMLTVFVLCYCIHLYYTISFSIGDIILVTTCCANIGRLLWDLGRMLKSFMDAYADAQETVNMMSEPEDIIEVPAPVKKEITSGNIHFDNITFCYPKKSIPVLQDFSLRIRSGEKVAIVGATGSGKSTLMKLLFRFYDVQQGCITVDNIPVTDFVLQDLRSSIAYVSQNPTLFNRSLLENVTYGFEHDLEEADLEKNIYDALSMAQCHFVQELEHGLHTRVGEYGKQLSGGEKQRISIARAILHKNPIVVLDEATSALDNRSEKEVTSAISTLLRKNNQTAIIIAHRLTTIMHCDRIVVLENGKVAEEGSHDTLLQLDGKYADLWNTQFAIA